MDHASIDALFDAAVNWLKPRVIFAEASRLYDLCGRADSKDAVAFYNLGNIQAGSRSTLKAADPFAYQRSLSRDPEVSSKRVIIWPRLLKRWDDPMPPPA